MYTTLNRIREHNPCKDGWETLLKYLGKTKPNKKLSLGNCWRKQKMNTRIKDLAVRARIGIWGNAYVNEFAMSIIQECITQAIQECINQAEKAKSTKEAIKAEPDFAQQLAKKSENFGIDVAVASIKKHFGIKK